MKSGETKRYPYQDQDRRTKIPIPVEDTPEQRILKEVFIDIERLTKGKEQLSKKELIELKKKYNVNER